jgi:hypothetical protein
MGAIAVTVDIDLNAGTGRVAQGIVLDPDRWSRG